MSTVASIYIPQDGQLSDLEGWIAGELGSAEIWLYDTYHAPSPADVPADFNEASFVGYSRLGPVSWGAPFTNGDGKAETDSPVLSWAFTGGSGTADVFGLLVVNAGGTRVLLNMPFLTPVTLSPGSPNLNRIIQLAMVSEL